MIFSLSTSKPRPRLSSSELIVKAGLSSRECCAIIRSSMTARAIHSCLLIQVCGDGGKVRVFVKFRLFILDISESSSEIRKTSLVLILTTKNSREFESR